MGQSVSSSAENEGSTSQTTPPSPSSGGLQTLPSVNLKKDVECLQDLFANTNLKVTSAASEGEYVILAPDGASGTGVLLLVQQHHHDSREETRLPQTSSIPWTWIMQSMVIQSVLTRQEQSSPHKDMAGSMVERISILDHIAVLVRLSASTLFLVPPELVQSTEGPDALAQRIRLELQHQHKEDTTKSHSPYMSADDVSTASSASASPPGSPISSPEPMAQSPNQSSTTQSTAPTRTTRAQNRGSSDDRVPPSFPTLNVKIRQGSDGYDDFQLNTTYAQDFETDLFKGKLLLLVKPAKPEDDPYWTRLLFGQKKRIFVWQMQGQLKRQPTGPIYFGGEISKPMRVGLLTKGVCNVLLRFLSSFVPDVVYSFGDDDPTQEKPRVVVPAHMAFGRLHVTPEGQTPPPVTSEPFEESELDQKQRLKSSIWNWNTTDTYSFTFFTMYFDCVQWKIVNIPGSPGGFKMSNFWGDADFDFVLYEHQPQSNGKNKKPKKHFQKDIQYLCSLQFHHVDNQSLDENSSSKTTVVDTAGKQQTNLHGTKSIPEDKEYDDFDNDGEMEVSRTSLDRAAAVAVVNRGAKTSLRHSESMTTLPLVEPLSDAEDEESEAYYDAEDSHVEYDDDRSTLTLDSASCKELQLLNVIDAIVPCWVEMVFPRNSNSATTNRGSYTKCFALNIGDMNDANKKAKKTVFRSKSDCESYLESSGLRAEAVTTICTYFSHRLSGTERTRRMLGYVLSKQKQQLSEILTSTLFSSSSETLLFTDHTFEDASSSVVLSTIVARARSDRHWVEEWAKIDNSTAMISFFRKTNKKRAIFRIAITSILSVSPLSDVNCPLFHDRNGFSFLYIGSIGRSTYLMFGSEPERDVWISSISKLLLERESLYGSESSLPRSELENNTRFIDVDSPSQEFMHNSTMWDCKKRRIYNSALFSFRAPRCRDIQQARLSEDVGLDPTLLVQESLKLAIQSMCDESISTRRRFLQLVARLKDVQLHLLTSEQERMGFFLNLYHTMVMHAYLILGPPTASLRFISLFKDVAYQVGDDIMSLAELEHCIIRAQMSFPSSFLSRFVIPKSRYACRLSTGDYRINFALNCGSVSTPAQVLVYNPETLDADLDAAVRLALEGTSSQCSGGDVTVSLPRVCQWFEQDFGTSDDTLTKLEPYFPEQVRQNLQRCWQPEQNAFDMARIWIRYDDFSFSCRPLSLLKRPSSI